MSTKSIPARVPRRNARPLAPQNRQPAKSAASADAPSSIAPANPGDNQPTVKPASGTTTTTAVVSESDAATVEIEPGVTSSGATGNTVDKNREDEEEAGACVLVAHEAPEHKDELATLANQIRDELSELGKILNNAVARKVRLGEMLQRAKALCKHGEWLSFLESIGFKPKSASENIKFFARRASIEEKRHGRAALTVEEVRLALAKPTESRRAKRRGKHVADGTASAPHTTEADAQPGEPAVEDAEREQCPDDDEGTPPSDDGEAIDVLDDDDDDDDVVDPAEQFLRLCENLVAVSDMAIESLSERRRLGTYVMLRRLVPMAQAELHRVAETLAAIDAGKDADE
jgi:hypothetical protein